jgi:hypothetical protein
MQKKTIFTLHSQSSISENINTMLNPVFSQIYRNIAQLGKEIIFMMPRLNLATYDFDKCFFNSILQNQGRLPGILKITRYFKADYEFSIPESSRRLSPINAYWLQLRIY